MKNKKITKKINSIDKEVSDVVNSLLNISEFDNTTNVEKEFVDHPNHYHPGTYEAINVIDAWKLDFYLGNALKYISRAGLKNQDKKIEDLQKAIWYITKFIEKEK